MVDSAKIRQLRKEYIEAKTMDVHWGAWVKQVGYDESTHSYSFDGIYDTIHKGHRADYPFYTDLRLVIQYQANPAEYERTFELVLDLIDQDAVNHLVTQEEEIVVPSGDSPRRWYDEYELKGVEFPEPSLYTLSILIDGQEKYSVPLWVTSPMGITWNEEDGTETKFWAEDFEKLQENGKI